MSTNIRLDGFGGEPLQERSVSRPSVERPVKVLVVDNSPPERSAWFKVISGGENNGIFEAIQVSSLSKALALVEREAFDVILLDLTLPDSLGTNTFSQLYSRVPEVPIVVTTVREDNDQALKLLREGAQDYLVKSEIDAPFLKRSLLYAIERHRTQVMLQHLSFNDDLTGLLNRRGFISLAEQQLKIAQREVWELVLLFADLDGLKNINDNFGHPEGDRALRTVATLLRETFRTSDLIARLGGDEFIVLAINAPAAGIQTMVTRLQRNIERYNAQNRFYQLSLSYGVAQFDPHLESSLEELIFKADQALYEQKRNKGVLDSESRLADS